MIKQGRQGPLSSSKVACTALDSPRHDMTWHDMTWHDMTWHDITLHDMTLYDMTWHDMTWYDMTWHDTTRHEPTRYGISWHDMTWHDVPLLLLNITPKMQHRCGHVAHAAWVRGWGRGHLQINNTSKSQTLAKTSITTASTLDTSRLLLDLHTISLIPTWCLKAAPSPSCCSRWKRSSWHSSPSWSQPTHQDT